jgi:tetratricopeptide (TPR) repeat protein
LALYLQAGAARGAGGVYVSLGNMHLGTGAVEVARGYFEKALSIHRAEGYATGRGLALGGLCEVALRNGVLEQAETLAREALVCYRDAGHKGHSAAVHGRLGAVLAKQQDYEGACLELEQALELYEEMNRTEGVALTCRKLGDIYLKLASEEVDKVEGMYRRALGAYEGLHDEHGRGQVYVGLGKTAAQRGETTQAIAMWSAASELFSSLGFEDQAQELQGAVRHVWSGGKIQVA